MTRPGTVIQWPHDNGALDIARNQVVAEGGGDPPTGPPEGYDGGMDGRVSKLEEFAADARERLAHIETTLSHMSHDVGQFKWWVAGSAVAIIFSMIAAVLGTGVAIQQMTVASFQAASQLAQPQQAQQPIIIQVPATTQQQTAPPGRR